MHSEQSYIAQRGQGYNMREGANGAENRDQR